MNSVPRSIAYALGNVLHPRMLWLMLWPLLLAVGLWGTVVIVFWAQLALSIADWLQHWLVNNSFFVQWDLKDAALFTAKLLMLIMLVPLIQLTALLILSMFGMASMVKHVANRRFPTLQRRQGGSLIGSAWNSLSAIVGMLGLGILSIPLWIFPPLWPLIPMAILAWVNQRILRYDALAEHADREEMRQVFAANRGALYAMGLILAMAAYIPVLGFFAPVLLGLSFIHYLLTALQEQREAPIEGTVL
jgi:CysZ protein